jgi:hypothetical protein
MASIRRSLSAVIKYAGSAQGRLTTDEEAAHYFPGAAGRKLLPI